MTSAIKGVARTRALNAASAMLLAGALWLCVLARPGAGRRSDQDRLQRVAHRRPRLVRQGAPAHQADLGRGSQRQGRPARPAGAARLLRRPDQCRHGARHLRQAHRRRQGRPADGRRDQPDRRRHAADHGAQEDGDGAARARHQRLLQLPALFPQRLVRARRQERRFAGRLLRGCQDHHAGAENGRAGGRGRGVLAERTVRRARKRQEDGPDHRLRPRLSAGHCRLRADRARRAGPNPDLVFVASYPVDSVGMVRAATELGLKTNCSAAAWSGCNTPRSCSSSPRSSTAW